MDSESKNLEIKNRAAEGLLALPGVVAVGLGSKEVDGKPTHEPAIKVYVEKKRPPDQVPPDELIPPEIDGVPTDVIESGELHDVADPPGTRGTPADDSWDNTRYRPLESGAQITVPGSHYAGTLGCFVVDHADASKVYAVTNYHVMAPPDTAAPVAGTTQVGQPTTEGSVTHCCSDLFGMFAGGQRSDDRDEALVRLEAGAEWMAQILEIGPIKGKNVVSVAQANAHNYKVRKRGARTQLTGGIVTAVNATTHEADNSLVVTPNANPAAAGATVFFAYEGDSGSALVNDANEVVALVKARSNSGLGFCLPFQHVLDRFASVEHVTADLATATTTGVVNTVPGAAMVATPTELAPALGTAGTPAPAYRPAPVAPPPGWFPDPIPLDAAPVHLQSDLDRSPTGRLLITIWLQHQSELLGLINTNRRVATAWHRSGAAALFQVVARMTIQPELALPETINGQPLRASLDRMHAILDRFGSAPLSKDLARLDAALPELAGLNYGQIIEAFGSG